MRKAITLALLLFVFFTSGAQNKKADTLRSALINARTDTDRFNALHDLGNLYYESYPDSAVYFDQQAYLLAKKNNWETNQGHELNNIASDYEALGDHANAILYYLKTLKIDEQINFIPGIIDANVNTGAVYNEKGDYRKSIPYLLLAQKLLLDYTRKHQLEPKYANIKVTCLLNLGGAYLGLQKPDSAKYYLDAAYKSDKETNGQKQIGVIQQGFGEVEGLKGNTNGALIYFKQALISDKASGDNAHLDDVYLNIARLYHKNHQPDSAIYYAEKSLEVATKGNFKQDILNASKELYNYYNEENNLQLAFKYFKLSTAVKDSLYSQDKIKQLLMLDFSEKERQQELQAEQAAAQNRLRIYILLASMAVLILLAIIFWRNGKHRQKANKLLKRQKEDIETAMAQLKRTQKQLIQSEKMASLGELTAGIAHEIQNPLNFVNNFSDVNIELIGEMEQEIEKGDLQEIKAIALDIKENEKKINTHGKRADFIVKGMLQHSRTSSGERQPTNINTLAEEFFKLSYQGLRAKDKSFIASLATHLDPNLPKISIVQQDMGRVLLNLFNNAFYAVNQKAKTAMADYKPEVTLSTSVQEDQVVISIKDNGTGIPDTIKEKILQPFFTTKPSGEGTGLGLSLSYDILVKGHSGTLDINSTEGQGSEFIIKLPMN